MWKTIKNISKYEVSSGGHVRNKKTRRVLKACKNSRGYLTVELYKDSIGKTYKVHRIVAENFCKNRYNKPFVDHINLDKTDNRSENLRWVSHLENMKNLPPLIKCLTCGVSSRKCGGNK